MGCEAGRYRLVGGRSIAVSVGSFVMLGRAMPLCRFGFSQETG
jgi:hypothetical protein